MANRRPAIIHTSIPSRILAALAAVAALAALGGCGNTDSTGSTGNGPGTGKATAAETVAGYVGGEKMYFLQNEKVTRILAERYGIAVDATKAGSVEMVSGLDIEGKDFLWPSNDIAVEFFRMNGGKIDQQQIVFNSPIVIYTGWNIANALIREGIVEKRNEGFYIVRFRELLAMVTDQTTWKDIGLNFYGKVSVRCTDPTRSNSGNMFAGLVANMLNDGEVVDEQSIEEVLPQLKQFFARLGMMEHSSGDIFRKFIATGINNSMVVGYENQAVEFILANPQSRTLIQDSVCVLYPEPTVWSSHPVISLNEKGSLLIRAMIDEEIQRIAWSDHGFRSGLVGVTIDPRAVNLNFMPETIDSVMPLPTPQAMQQIVDELKTL
jgi:hypothetical protein